MQRIAVLLSSHYILSDQQLIIEPTACSALKKYYDKRRILEGKRKAMLGVSFPIHLILYCLFVLFYVIKGATCIVKNLLYFLQYYLDM